LALLITGLSVGTAVAGDVNVNIGAPAVVMPPPIVTTRPPVVMVPGTPVYSAPSVDFTMFVFGGKYWSHHNDVWFVSPGPGGRWTRVAVATVPREVRGVPITYYKVKPKHAKAGVCPPGRAKYGRC
jgi:hypothetical protein